MQSRFNKLNNHFNKWNIKLYSSYFYDSIGIIGIKIYFYTLSEGHLLTIKNILSWDLLKNLKILQ